jgi:hypothetical protein
MFQHVGGPKAACKAKVRQAIAELKVQACLSNVFTACLKFVSENSLALQNLFVKWFSLLRHATVALRQSL